MKKTLYILLLFFCQTTTSQTTESEKVFWDLIDYKLYPDKYSDVGYLDKVDFGMLKYQLSKIKKDTNLRYFDNRVKKNDSIILSLEEKEYLISELNSSENYSWNLAKKKNLIKVERENILEFLKADKNRELKIISKPIFIRKGKVACVFSVHLCCGDIYGYVSIALYKRMNGKWERWIPLSEGAF
ncbi:hypothetical protein ACOSP6_00390 [Tenacibaculum sp. MEBiC06402]|uniref:hypothetical protein n=1 Tax=unclassified Tenacibaculum TaxID=2635139 RepID=UPI003B9A7C0C